VSAPSSPGLGTEPRPGRPRDAAASRQALLAAAQSLFGQQGFEGTTIREIGEQAGVDGSLIARYFGSKADLYVAAVVAEGQGDGPAPAFERLEEMARAMLARAAEHGPGPVTQAVVRSDTSPEIRQAALAHLRRRLVDPLVATMAEPGAPASRLRVEIAVSALLGVTLGRSLGWFDQLSAVPEPELVALLTEILGPVTGGPTTVDGRRSAGGAVSGDRTATG
jgi:AcrR family transcriptional regulator